MQITINLMTAAQHARSDKTSGTVSGTAGPAVKSSGLSFPAMPVLQPKAAGEVSFESVEPENSNDDEVKNAQTKFIVQRQKEDTEQPKVSEPFDYLPQQQRPGKLHQLTPFQSPVQKKKNNTGLPDRLRKGVENLSGYSMDSVKVHYNSDKPGQLSAYAYAQGTDIHIAPGQEKHLPHEAWHVVQQMQGRVQSATQMKGGIQVNDDKGLEQEADAMGIKALQPVMENHAYSVLKYSQPGAGLPTAQMRGVTLAIVQAAIGGAFRDTSGDTQSSSADTAIANGIKYHISIIKNDPGNLHISYYPAGDDEYKNKILHVGYSWRADTEAFGAPAVLRDKWQPFKAFYGYITAHAAGAIETLKNAIIGELNRPAVPIAIPIAREEEAGDIPGTPEHEPLGGWPDTPPGNSFMFKKINNNGPVQLFKDPVSGEEVNSKKLMPHEAYYYYTQLLLKKLPDTTPDEILDITMGYARGGFEIPGYDYSEEGDLTLKKIPVLLSAGTEGAFSYLINWALSKPASEHGGYIIQTVAVIENTNTGGIPKQESSYYQEAWHVPPGKLITEGYAEKLLSYANDMTIHGEDTLEGYPNDDEFGYDEGPGGDTGSISMAGEAIFYDGMTDLPGDFIVDNPLTIADQLPSRVGNKKDDLTGTPSNTVQHFILVKWDKSKDDGKTQVVSFK